jgi:hypothetical protein
MLCKFSRWMISRAEDAGKASPRIAERHVRRCHACGEYARTVASLSSRLRSERSSWLAGVADFPVGPWPAAAASPATDAATRAPRRSWLGLRPLPVAAAVLLVVAGAFILFQVVLRTPRPSAEERAAALAALKMISAAPEEIGGAIKDAESPLDKERRILENSLVSAANYLQARLNIKIERREPQAKSS